MNRHVMRCGRLAARFLVAAYLTLLAACASGPPPATHTQARPPLAPIRSGATCLADLDHLGVAYLPAPQIGANAACQIDTPIRIAALSVGWNQAATMSCGLADVLWRFETELVIPTAQKIFGKPVVSERNLGAYACRAEASSRHRVSQHALGRAIDLAGWTLADGTRIEVEKDWGDHGKHGRFLRLVAEGACRYFSVVLTPATNGLHHDHLHLDIGPDRLCSVG